VGFINDDHLAALVGAAVAHRGTSLTMLVGVLLAFNGAGFADFQANAADFAGEMRFSGHESDCRSAEFGAIVVPANALGQMVGIGLGLTCRRTAVAFVGAA
jgi:hypothetical protein